MNELVGKVQGGHVSLGKRQRGVREARLRDHAGREVDAHGIDAVPGEKGADVSRAASEVADGVTLSRAPSCRGREPGQDLAVEGLVVQLMEEMGGVRRRHRVVGGRGVGPPARVEVTHGF